MIRIRSRRVFTTEIRIVQVVTQLTDGQRREIYISSIIIGPAIAVLVEPTATALAFHVSAWRNSILRVLRFEGSGIE